MESIQIYNYEGQDIEFDLTSNTVMVNATEMAKVFGKKVENFTRIEQTKEFIQAYLKNANKRFIEEEKSENSRFSGLEVEVWIIPGEFYC